MHPLFRPLLVFARRQLCYLLSVIAPVCYAGGIPTLDTVEVVGSTTDLLGTADAANVGTITTEQLQARPLYRIGELLEETPGLIVTQHSGEGKANQYFLRGFNLDHGTDLRVSVDGMPVNQRSHGHGQGWADLNFLIPELAVGLQYKKGPYFAEEGDFSAAGAVNVDQADTLSAGIAALGLGEDGFRRAVLADSPALGAGHMLYGLELFRFDGPWVHPEDYQKVNGILRYSQGTARDGFNVTAMVYSSDGDATNQIARRAVDSGLISRFGLLDESDGSDTERYSLSANWRRGTASSSTQANAYLIDHDLKLFSNFTYFLDNPKQGDQFLQQDRRLTTGIHADHTWFTQWNGCDMDTSIGVQAQNDNIYNGLFNTARRSILSTTRKDHIVESSLGLYAQNRLQWMEKFRTVAGVRGDLYEVEVDSDNALNSGSADDSIVNPKLSLIFGPWAKTEYYVNLGGGFHSNDARGATISVDPKSAETAEQVPLLVRAKGYELGLRTAIIPRLQSTFTLYRLDFDSELLFIGDAGGTEASRPSERTGFEFANFYTLTDWLIVDLDIAFARARFDDNDEAGNRIPGAVEGVATLGLSIDNLGPYFGGLQLRYFGPRPLIEDNSIRSANTTLLSGRVGYRINERFNVAVEGFNLLDREASQIDYFYTSRLPGEPAEGIDDFHFHPVEPRLFRLTATYLF